jgi:hypothetical protein
MSSKNKYFLLYMTEKYLLSICYVDDHNEIFSEPYGLFDTFLQAQIFAHDKIDEMRLEYIDDYGEMIVNEAFEFDFTIKKIYT